MPKNLGVLDSVCSGYSKNVSKRLLGSTYTLLGSTYRKSCLYSSGFTAAKEHAEDTLCGLVFLVCLMYTLTVSTSYNGDGGDHHGDDDDYDDEQCSITGAQDIYIYICVYAFYVCSQGPTLKLRLQILRKG